MDFFHTNCIFQYNGNCLENLWILAKSVPLNSAESIIFQCLFQWYSIYYKIDMEDMYYSMGWQNYFQTSVTVTDAVLISANIL